MDLHLRDAVAADAESLAALYNHYVRHSHATFELQDVAVGDMAQRVAAVQAVPLPWLVAERRGGLAGYAYAAPWKNRPAYRYSVETTIYLHPAHCGQGVGTHLYRALLDRLAGLTLHVAIGGVALPNPASVALHERLGFRKAAHFEQVGWKFGRWVDVGYWQRRMRPRDAPPA